MKKIILLSLLLLSVSCEKFGLFRTPLYKLSEEKREKQIVFAYEDLSRKYYLLLEDEIKEKERYALEEKFQELQKELEVLRTNLPNKKQLKSSTTEHRGFLDKYWKETTLKLQYLKDLQ